MADSRRKSNELCRRVSLADLIERRVKLAQRGNESIGLCPFHHEKTPSFCVVEDKGFFHCFGCGAHGDAIGWLMRSENIDYAAALAKLADEVGLERETTRTPQACSDTRLPRTPIEDARRLWVPIVPVPTDAPALLRPDGRTTELINPKQAGTPKECTRYWPVLWWPYRDAEGRLLGYVLRLEFRKPDGMRGKYTPQITFCAGPGGARRWCVVPFPQPRPLYPLAELAARPDAPVLVVEGEKTCDAGRRLLPGYVVACWPGGSKGIAHVDWSPLSGRDVLLLPDADKPGRTAVDGWIGTGGRVLGIAERLAPFAKRVRVVDPPADLPEGWDLANAKEGGWSQTQTACWIRENLRPGAIAIEASTPGDRFDASITSVVVPADTPRRGPPAALDRRRLEGLIRTIIGAPEAQLDATLRWAARRLSGAVLNGEIKPYIAEALLLRAAARRGLAAPTVQRVLAGSL